MSCPYDHPDCDGQPLTCLVRESEALGLYESGGGRRMTRGQAWEIMRREYGALTLDDDPEWAEEMVHLLIAGDPSVSSLIEGDDTENDSHAPRHGL